LVEVREFEKPVVMAEDRFREKGAVGREREKVTEMLRRGSQPFKGSGGFLSETVIEVEGVLGGGEGLDNVERLNILD
jgi:hypothetical protein